MISCAAWCQQGPTLVCSAQLLTQRRTCSATEGAYTEPSRSLPLSLLLWMFCRCFTVISRISAFSSLDCCWEMSSLEVNLIQTPLFTDRERASHVREILTSSLNAPITVSLSWSKQVFILSRRFLSMSGFLSCKRKLKKKEIKKKGSKESETPCWSSGDIDLLYIQV